MPKAAFIYHDTLSRHILREGHPMRPTRLRYTYELLSAYGAFSMPDSFLIEPRAANMEELTLIHDAEYVSAVESISKGENKYSPTRYNFDYNGDNPPYEGMYEASVLSSGASIVAAEAVLTGATDTAFNVSGGLHHAARSWASGFCIFNDPAVIIAGMVRDGMRVMYVDIDAHHGDGVQNAFYTSNRVLTVSFHESGRYLFPGTGEARETGEGEGQGYSVNIPLLPYTGDEIYLLAFEDIVPPLISGFRPDVVVAQLGVDAHYMDPLAHLNLTSEAYTTMVKRMLELSPKLICVGGGGYSMDAVPRVWALEYGVLLGVEWLNDIPASYQEQYGIRKLRDETPPAVDQEVLTQARRYARDGVETIQRRVFQFHGL